jgi:hypothetical protein
MLTQNEYNKFWEMVCDRLLADRNLRLGQCMFNALFRLNEPVSKKIVEMGLDPFYNEAVIKQFIAAIKPK